MLPLAISLAAVITCGTVAANAQQTDTVPQKLAPVVTVTREKGRSPLEVPFAVSTTQPDSARPGQKHTLLDETLFLLPGVTVSNRNNPSQDPRVSIRGFGARSAFAVRGIRILRDGMPLTLADGSTPVDYLDLESVGEIEVIRGSASALYGNASGGVIDVHSAPPPAAPFAGGVRGLGGSNSFQRWTGIFGGTDGPVGYLGDFNYTDQNGSRDHSRQRVTSGYGRAAWTTGKTNLAFQVLGFDEPLAENPGALTRARLDSAPTMADPQSVLKRARKVVSQVQLGLSADRPVGSGQLTANIYGGTRDLYNPLTYAVVDLGRASYGGGARFAQKVRFIGLDHNLTFGADVAQQSDHRRNWANCNAVATSPSCPTPGQEQGVIQIDQNEDVSSIGPYLRDELGFANRYFVTLGVRADYVRFQVHDHLITETDPDNSGNRTLHAVSPIGGVSWRYRPLHSVYANVSTAFETPTTTELGTQPSGAAGLNPDLQPQYSTTYEVGAKGIAFLHLRYDASVFDTEVRDELIPYQVPGSSGRVFYRNAGHTRRQGIEIGISALVGDFTLGGSYTLSHFRFQQFVVDSASYAGNSIPGIPVDQLQLSATWKRGGYFVSLEGIAESKMFVDDGNTTAAPGYSIMSIRLGGTSLFGQPSISPVLGISNLFDARYVGSVSVNASLGKFFEPAPGRTLFAGLSVNMGR
jgi:iron complex outermembrane receptor protein